MASTSEKSLTVASSSAEKREPTDFDDLLESLLTPSDGTPGGRFVDLSPYLEQGSVLGIGGAHKPQDSMK